jgi:predicted nucleic acid-binding protein
LKPSTVVADTSPLIALAVMELLPVLPSLFKKVIVPSTVVRECLGDLSKPRAAEISEALSSQILIEQSVTDQDYCEFLGLILDAGEAEAIALSKELSAVVMIDERAARKVAAREGVECIGSLYVLIKAKQAGLIPEVALRIQKLRDHGYYLSQSLFDFVLDKCQEFPANK